MKACRQMQGGEAVERKDAKRRSCRWGCSVAAFVIGAWKGATEQKGQQRVLGVEDAEKLLSGMQRMLHLRELGNRWGRTR